MRVMTILGTRPEIIRLSIILGKLDGLCSHTVVHTGQNFDPSLSERFFQDLALRPADIALKVREESTAAQIAAIFRGCEEAIRRANPDRVLVLGDTDSALSALIAKRMGVPVYHLEAGNRCFDDLVPEEVNRNAIDHISDVLLPYTERSRLNLIREGIPSQRIFVVGNPIFEVLKRFQGEIGASGARSRLGLVQDGYFLATLHRSENVDRVDRLASLAATLRAVRDEFRLPVVISLHPHTRRQLQAQGIELGGGGLSIHEPFGFFDFVDLERSARCVLTDSGTVQEEAAILGRPSVTLRDTTERPETVECGSNILVGVTPESVVRGVRTALAKHGTWDAPREYLVPNVSDIVVGILLGEGPSPAASGHLR